MAPADLLTTVLVPRLTAFPVALAPSTVASAAFTATFLVAFPVLSVASLVAFPASFISSLADCWPNPRKPRLGLGYRPETISYK